MGGDINLKELLQTYTKHWKWFVLSCLVAVSAAFFHLRYATPLYNVSAKVQIMEENGGGALDLFKDLDVFSGSKNNVLDEIEMIRSRSNFIEVVKTLKLNTGIYEVGDIRTSEIYNDLPININFLAEDSVLNKAEYGFYLTLQSKTTFVLNEEEDSPGKKYAFGKNVPSPIGDIVITPNLDHIEKYLSKKIRVSVTPVDIAATFLRNSIAISSSDEKSNIVNISLNEATPKKAKQIINNLINVHNQNAINDKQIIADRTKDFINERIADISSSLESVDESAENLRTRRGITDISSETSINLNQGAANQQQLVSARNELNMATSMKEIVDSQQSFEELPANLGLSDPTIASTTAKFNELVLERKKLLKNANEKNPVIVNLDQRLQGLKSTLRSSLNSTVNNLGLTVNTLSGQQAIINSRINSAPGKERALRDITRQQETTESLYLYLLQKREEAQIAAVSTAPKCKIIDLAHQTSRAPVSPKRRVTFLAALIVGMFIPFSIIYIKDLLDNKVRNMQNLEKLVEGIPIVGEIPKVGKKNMNKISIDDRSVLSEALRLFRTNLDYLIKTRGRSGDRKNNVVFISSSLAGEGKTFVSSNLAMILASTGKKVLMIGADIRNPKIHNFFSGQNITNIKTKSNDYKKSIGLTEYLIDEKVEISDLLNTMLVDKNEIDIIYSGRIPLNPAELLMSERMKRLFDLTSKMYDYVIVDTAPMMVVTDTLLIAPYADHLIYVTRAGVTENTAVQYPIKLQEEGKIKGLSFVVNDVSDSNLGYGGQYGYGYGKSTKKWWKFS